MVKKKLKLNADLNGHLAGYILNIDCDDKGIPLDQYWRRRLRDSKIDSCVEIVKEPAKDKPAQVKIDTKNETKKVNK